MTISATATPARFFRLRVTERTHCVALWDVAYFANLVERSEAFCH